jgi:minor histocompatibility antigen H13
MMVTVAKSIDAPIKLVFPRPDAANSDKPQYAMLGLGDVVLPGIMIGLALRFDLWIFYLRRQKRVQPTEDSSEGVEKPKYFSLSGRWSDHFWSHSFFGRPLWASHADKPEPHFTFPKTYFKASLTGYILGMFATLGVMHIWGHAQPALLYLVPGVLGSLWLTALARGELSLMWNFSEETEEEEEGKDKTDEKDSENKKSRERESVFSLSDKKAQAREERMKKVVSKHVVADSEDDGNDGENTKDKVKAVAGHRSRRELFSFSIEAPHDLKHPRSLMDDKTGNETAKADKNKTSEHEPVSVPTVSNKADEGHAGKRARLN